MLGAVAGIVIDVALGLHDDAPLRSRQFPQCDVVRQRAGRHEDGAFLAEPARERVFQFFDDTAVGIDVGLQWPGRRDLVQKMGVFQGAEMGAVVDEIDGLLQSCQLIRGSGRLCSQGRGRRSPRHQRAAVFEHLSSPHGSHRSLVARVMRIQAAGLSARRPLPSPW